MSSLLETVKEIKKYRFSLIRYVPDKLRGEYINVGVILHSLNDNQVNFRLLTDYSRLRCFDPYFWKSDLTGFQIILEQRLSKPFTIDQYSVERRHLKFPPDGLVTKQSPDFLELLQLTLSGKFQITKPDGGLAENPAEILTNLYEALVQPASEQTSDSNQLLKAGSASQRRKILQNRVRAALEKEQLLGNRFEENVVVPGTDEKHGFSFGSLNGVANLIEVASLSYKRPEQKELVVESLIGKIDLVWKKSMYGPEQTEYRVLIETPLKDYDFDLGATQSALKLLQDYHSIITLVNPTKPQISEMVRQISNNHRRK